jgi:hypothetical protein
VQRVTALTLCVAAVVVLTVADDQDVPPETDQARNLPGVVQAVHFAVDPRVELMAVICRLAGFPDYIGAPVPGYARDVDSYFGPHRGARAPALFAELREAGMPAGAPVVLASRLSDVQHATWRETTDEDTSVSLLVRESAVSFTLEDGEAGQLLGAICEFAQETRFREFFDQHAELYETVRLRVAGLAAENLHPEWFSSYFGGPRDREVSIHVALLGGRYSVGTQFTCDGRSETHIVLGVSDRDGDGLPDVGDAERNAIVHEMCHAYTVSLTGARAEDLQEAGETLWSRAARRLADDPCADWFTMIEESIVRACTSRYLSQNVGWWEATRDGLDHQVSGFTWVPALATMLEEQYEADRQTYPTFESFMPQIVQFFTEYAEFYDSAPPAPGRQQEPASTPEQDTPDYVDTPEVAA